MAGAQIQEQLSFKVLVVKLITAPLTLGAQFFLGRVDGHIGAALAANLGRLFKRIKRVW